MIISAAPSTGSQIDEAVIAFPNTWNPASIMPDGVTAPNPAAFDPNVCIDAKMLVAIAGPLLKSHQKNPVVIVKRRNSA
jgi:hypothetical protein